MAMEGDSDCVHGINLEYAHCFLCEKEEKEKPRKLDLIFDLILGVCGIYAWAYLGYHGYYHYNTEVTFGDLYMATIAIVVPLRSKIKRKSNN